MMENKNIQCELQIVTKKAHWFLDHLVLLDRLTVLFVTLITFSGIYFRLGVLLPTVLLLLIIGSYFYFIRFSKNYLEQGKAIVDIDGILIGGKKYDWKDVEICFKAYKKYVEWSYKQVLTNSIAVGSEKWAFIMNLNNLENLKELAENNNQILIKNILKNKR